MSHVLYSAANITLISCSGTSRALADIRGDVRRTTDSGARPASMSVLGHGRQHSAEAAAAAAAAEHGNGAGVEHSPAVSTGGLQVCQH